MPEKHPLDNVSVNHHVTQTPLTPEIMGNIGIHFHNKGQLEESKKWLLAALNAQKEYASYQEVCYTHLGDIAKKEQDVNWKNYYQKGVECLAKRRKKTDLEIYHLASLYKKMGKQRDAIRWFKKMLDRYPHYSQLAGAFFHLGELYFIEKSNQKAEEMFRKCLSIFADHKKATEYLDQIASLMA